MREEYGKEMSMAAFTEDGLQARVRYNRRYHRPYLTVLMSCPFVLCDLPLKICSSRPCGLLWTLSLAGKKLGEYL